MQGVYHGPSKTRNVEFLMALKLKKGLGWSIRGKKEKSISKSVTWDLQKSEIGTCRYMAYVGLYGYFFWIYLYHLKKNTHTQIICRREIIRRTRRVDLAIYLEVFSDVSGYGPAHTNIVSPSYTAVHWPMHSWDTYFGETAFLPNEDMFVSDLRFGFASSYQV